MMPERKPHSLEEARSANEDFFGGIYQNLRLIGRLLLDRRVPFWMKLLPIGALIYLIVPMDFIPIVPLDDALALYLGGSLFIELCPPDVVREHQDALMGHMAPDRSETDTPEEVIDVESRNLYVIQKRDQRP